MQQNVNVVKMEIGANKVNIHLEVFATGVNGQLGYDIVKELLKHGHAVIYSGSGQR